MVLAPKNLFMEAKGLLQLSAITRPLESPRISVASQPLEPKLDLGIKVPNVLARGLRTWTSASFGETLSVVRIVIHELLGAPAQLSRQFFCAGEIG
ncbi:hypothetical protein VQ03_07615 [Methylobacterium tarhaniae]|uniref:Uncharacterized protein n=1 Tax=Methylobacterium tarhaniae TaxID=1187852 RepID=A0A0J6TCL9_9HYPH|nr:hypothetical protein VQ03_07615 [Methylobacterium tarhaniae]